MSHTRHLLDAADSLDAESCVRRGGRPRCEDQTSRYAETTFRALNEQIRLLFGQFEMTGQWPIPFVCECRSQRCFARVEIPLVVYEAIRASHGHRLIVPGHQAEGEQVVVETPVYAVVRLAEPDEAG